jgi:3-phosphoshikimate 1-carboxyvinyltransferase
MAAMSSDSVVVRPATRLRGRPSLPGDKSISHRALLLALLAAGESRIVAAGDGADVRSTAGVVAALGARVERLAERAGRVDYRVISPGGEALVEPEGILDCGNSGTTTRLVAGLLAGRPLFAVLDGDASLRRRPMGRVVEPLRALGAAFAGRGGDTLLPMAVRGRARLSPIDYRTPVPSAQVKSAILLAGLAVDGETRVTEAVATRDHTERMLRARGVTVREETAADGTHSVTVVGPGAVAPIADTVPADPSGAAFWLVAAAIHPDAELRLEGVSTNPTRRAIIDILRRMGASIEEIAVEGHPGPDGEPLADLVVRSSELRGIDLSPAEVAGAIDEIPILALAAAAASGTTRFRGASELRHKESDRVAGIAAGLAALGADIRVEGDDIEIRGGRRLTGAATETHDDHRLAMTFAVAGLIAEGETVIDRAGSAAISYPGFFRELEGVRA